MLSKIYKRMLITKLADVCVVPSFFSPQSQYEHSVITMQRCPLLGADEQIPESRWGLLCVCVCDKERGDGYTLAYI